MFEINSALLIALLAVLCCLAGYDLWHQYQMNNESFWYFQYTEAVRSTSDFWNFGFRLERLEEKNVNVLQSLQLLKFRVLDDTTSFRKNPLRKTALGQSVTRLMQNDSSVIQIRCGGNNGLLRIGVSDFRADPRDACQLFTGSIITAPGPETVFEFIDQPDGAFSLKSISSALFLQVVPPPLDNIAAPWKIVAGSPVIGPAERFRMSDDGYIYSSLMAGFLQCSADDMIKGYPGQYATPSVFEFDPLSEEAILKFRQLVSLSDQIRAIQEKHHIEAKRRIATERIRSESSSSRLNQKTKQKILLGVPMTSVKTNMMEITESPFWTNLFSSFMETVDWKSDNFIYAFYLGFDKADPIYDTGDAWHDIREHFAKKATYYLKTQLLDDAAIEIILKEKLFLKLFHFEHLQGAPSQIVSQVILQGYKDGFDYFYQVNDDSQLDSLNWAEKLVETLENSDPVPNFGVTGPRDTNNEKIFTHSFTHRTHIDIFGFLFPPSFKNWWSDDWISTVYGGSYTFLLNSVQIRHNVAAQKTSGYTRYEVDKGAKLRLDDELINGYIKINKWLRNNHYPALSLPVICSYIPLLRGIYDPLLAYHSDSRAKEILENIET